MYADGTNQEKTINLNVKIEMTIKEEEEIDKRKTDQTIQRSKIGADITQAIGLLDNIPSEIYPKKAISEMKKLKKIKDVLNSYDVDRDDLGFRDIQDINHTVNDINEKIEQMIEETKITQ